MSQTSVRKMLHPTLDDELLVSTKLWVPGFLSKGKAKTNHQTQS